MIIDCFPFFNELDLLEIRLNVLKDVVDKFVLVEASKTQSLIDKPFYFEENKDRYSKFLDKIIHVKITDYPKKDGWAMENYQRNCIVKGLQQLELKEEDIIGVSDLDEIWFPEIKDKFQEYFKEVKFISVEMKYLVFYLNLETVDKKWIGTIFAKAKDLINYTPQNLRNIKDHVSHIEEAGWHFGYQGGKEKVYNKYLSCIEPLDKSKIPSKEDFFKQFDDRIKHEGSFIYSDDLNNTSVRLNKINVEDNLPKYILSNIDKYNHMILS
jgi:beta-1,4-mannosyl-glycoprotein beta-1,4-N-acetylglucosaminyltransferase